MLTLLTPSSLARLTAALAKTVRIEMSPAQFEESTLKSLARKEAGVGQPKTLVQPSYPRSSNLGQQRCFLSRKACRGNLGIKNSVHNNRTDEAAPSASPHQQVSSKGELSWRISRPYVIIGPIADIQVAAERQQRALPRTISNWRSKGGAILAPGAGGWGHCQ
jgi:hypothetical protein